MAQFTLPSIHELFPAHLLRPENDYNRHKYQERPHTPRTRCASYPPTQRMPQSRPYSHHTESLAHDPRLHESDARPHAADHRKRSASQIYSFDVLRSDPMSSSLQHLTSSGNNPPPSSSSQQQQQQQISSSSSEFRVSVPPTAAANNIHSPQGQRSGPQPTDPAVSAMISFPVSRPPTSKSSSTKQSPSDEASGDEEPGECAGKKHICPTCLKRFNRPSSLRIHVNTHTGATPFRCPWPNCGREFNVNSNMRRHYRNHTTPGFARVQPTDNRRKRRRVDGLNSSSNGGGHHHHHHSMPVAAADHHHHHHQVYHRKTNLMPSPPISHFSSASDESEYDSEMEEYDDSLRHSPYPPHHVNNNATNKRDLHKYNPSAPYMHSLADTRVSTALRPAYHS